MDAWNADDERAAARFPGPDYLAVLGWLHEDLQPAVYVEIGVHYGASLRLAAPGTDTIGIDPRPLVSTPGRIFAMTSATYFHRHAPPPFSLAFIDGEHLFERSLADFRRLERHAAPDALIALHDTIPLDRTTAARRRTADFHTGDVWKTVAFLHHHRPDLRIATVRTAPTGLTLVRGLDPQRARYRFTDVRRFARLGWDYWTAHQGEFLPTIPNHRASIQRFLQ